jgi:hypothetical protein
VSQNTMKHGLLVYISSGDESVSTMDDLSKFITHLKVERAAVIARITHLVRLERLTAGRQLTADRQLRLEKPSDTNYVAKRGALTVA